MVNETSPKLDLRSVDITEEKKQQLKQLFPEVFREDEIDFDNLKRVLGEWLYPGKERFGLNCPGKIVKHDEYGGNEKVYMVKETKGTTSKEQLRISELAKIQFGKAHFDSIGVDYSWVTSASEV